MSPHFRTKAKLPPVLCLPTNLLMFLLKYNFHLQASGNLPPQIRKVRTLLRHPPPEHPVLSLCDPPPEHPVLSLCDTGQNCHYLILGVPSVYLQTVSSTEEGLSLPDPLLLCSGVFTLEVANVQVLLMVPFHRPGESQATGLLAG